MKTLNIIFITLVLLFTSCKKDDGDVLLTEEPIIELVKVKPESQQVQQFSDELIFTISYTDGDGDLGTDDPDLYSIELIDTRNPSVLKFEYHLSPRAPSGTSVAVTGELNVVLEHTILIDDSNNSEATTFKIRIKDRAGNWSNEVETNFFTITK